MHDESIPWENTKINVFWGEIAPYTHFMQVYSDEKHFLDSLEHFVIDGFNSNESVIVIGTEKHLHNLNDRLRNKNHDLNLLANKNRYFPLNAQEMLATFMRNNWPDENLFHESISSIINAARTNNRRVRAFGEMVAVLWEQGLNGATVHLENLWNQLHSQSEFSLYCAYPQSGFTQKATHSIQEICKAHSKIISGEILPATEIYNANK